MRKRDFPPRPNEQGATPGKAVEPPVALADQAQKATDHFIHQRLPQWIRDADAEDLATLRALLSAHKTSQDQVRLATAAVPQLETFADDKLSEALANILPSGERLSTLRWRDKALQLEGVSVPRLEASYEEHPALPRLMQNFAVGATPLQGSGLLAAGTETALDADLNTLIDTCRQLDAGAQYQALLEQVFKASEPLLVTDKLAGFKLAVHVAFLSKTIDGQVRDALQAVIADVTATDPAADATATITAYPGLLSMLGVRVHESLFIQLRGADDEDKGVVIFRPGDANRPLHRYPSQQQWAAEMAGELQDEKRRAAFIQLIALEDRASFFSTLLLRLEDEVPDLQLEGQTGHGHVFLRWAQSQYQRAQSDARLLLVPTADADAKASRERLESWKSLGWGLLNLAGFFIPGVGALLLAQLVAQLCAQVYEGAEDWAEGHDHEALQHALGVAETVAAAAITVGVVVGAEAAGRRFVRSAFVDAMEPMTVGPASQRLWHDDLGTYRTSAQAPVLEEGGLYSDGERSLMHIDSHYYELNRPEEDGAWRLRHPLRPGGWGPVVEGNGERFWALHDEQPLAWSDAAAMLNRLWPQANRLSKVRAERLLQAACSDVDELRGILIENRALPANLRHTLRHFDADERINGFFEQLAASVPADDQAIHEWCRQHPVCAGLEGDEIDAAIIEQASELRSGLFSHLTRTEPSADQAVRVILRDFPGLPADYADSLASTVNAQEREVIVIQRRLPLPVMNKARALLQLARLSQAQMGLMLRNAYSDVTGEVVLNLMARLGRVLNKRLVLRQGSTEGSILSVLDWGGAQREELTMVHETGEFKLYDRDGRPVELDIPDTDDFFSCMNALMSPANRTSLQLGDTDPAGVLRDRLLEQVPRDRRQLLDRFGWKTQPGWFNPGQRLPDGRVGYVLGGGGSRPWQDNLRLRRRLLALYRGSTPTQIEAHVTRILQCVDPFEQLLFEEGNFQALNARLDRWVNEADELETSARRLLAQRLRSAWRRQLTIDLQHEGALGYQLDLSGSQVTSLPELSGELDFHFVTSMVMMNTPLRTVPEAFFSSFGGLRRLNLSRNALRAFPASLRHLTSLASLDLSFNRITMDGQGTRTLSRLHQLDALFLNGNRLSRLTLQFIQAPALRRLHLRGCQLLEWPSGLEHCGLLRDVNLNYNQLSDVPETILQMPYEFRAAIHLGGNAVPVVRLRRLYARNPHRRHAQAAASEAAAVTREAWVQGTHRQVREVCWDRLFSREQNGSVLRILRELRASTDFINRAYRDVLVGQVWTLLDEMDANAVLEQEIRAIADEPITCVDSVAERFSDLQVRALVAKANRSSGGTQDDLLELGVGLFRLDRLEAFIRDDLEQRSREMPSLDLIEARLYYIVNLAREMQIPGQPASMTFAALSGGDPSMLGKAREYVKKAETVEAKANFLSDQAFWSSHLEARYPAEFAAINDDFDQQGTALDDSRETLNDQQYCDGWEALKNARDGQLHRLKVLLTRQVLEGRNEPAGGQSSQSD
ncbi:MAG: NEL-type E3 ubiquitin ligase domain-containing protein [Candidatus Pseudomonas phytovorans]|uniref:RING-type E3 ubiquitin transferase n=1 Tax=Candidatus Pseudomonas phytovorans TaxID=3121377 RepID=A0AAJ5WFB3_9PSED|nr:NEL-type E3 ubiquitin ligase domain-containing protein [Pseudomonas sp.]WEK29326.1 MAG: NEL-type E3 ubiquitin ligase domain-containing protein [Pseudomonas sp.]